MEIGLNGDLVRLLLVYLLVPALIVFSRWMRSSVEKKRDGVAWRANAPDFTTPSLDLKPV